MAKRGENIYKRKDGRWEARYVKGYALSGRIKYGSCYGRTYTEAKEKAGQAKAALLNHTPAQTGGSRRRFAAFCEDWLRQQESRVKMSTYARYYTTVERHISPRLGNCLPPAIDTQAVESFKQSLLEEDGLAPKTVKDILAVLRAVLRFTAKQCPGSLPEVEIVYPRVERRERRVLSAEEQRRLSLYLLRDMDCCKFGVMLALMTGLRIGELCALRWGDISLRERTLRVASTMQRLPDAGGGLRKTQVVVASPKSRQSARTIPLSESAARLCEQIGRQSPAAYVLTGTEHYMEPRTLQYRMKRYVKECGLEGVHFHTLRHTFATRCVEAGFELKSLSEILGHASPAVTMDCYVHSSMELKRINMDKLTAVGL